MERALGTATAHVDGVRERAVGFRGLLPLLADELAGLFPRDALPLAAAAGRALDALHGVLDARFGIGARDARLALEAGAEGIVLLRAHVHDVAIAHIDVVLAERAAPAAGAEVLVAGDGQLGFLLLVLIGLQILHVAARAAGGQSAGQGRARGGEARSLQKGAAGQ